MEFRNEAKGTDRYIYTKDSKPSLSESLSTAHDWELELYYSAHVFGVTDYRKEKGEDWVQFDVPAKLRYKMRINVPVIRTQVEGLNLQGQEIPDDNMKRG
jgi:hypothetical protein